MKGVDVYIGIGSNLGDRVFNCLDSIDRINRLSGCSAAARSSIFETEPVGVTGQDYYLNCAVRVTTSQSPSRLLTNLMDIESAMGRVRIEKWGARIIDLDILLFGNEVIKFPDLEIPHPLLHKREFVLEPLAQLAPDYIHPVLKLSIVQLLSELPKGPYVEVLKEER